MTLTDAQWIARIILEVGDTATGLLATNVPIYWSVYAGSSSTLQYLLTTRDAIRLLLGAVREDVDRVSGSDQLKASQAFDHLLAMLKDTDDLIQEATMTSGAAGAAGELTRTAPIMPPTGYRDSNLQEYRGSPYQQRRRWRR